MVLNLIQEIGDYLKANIPFFDNYEVNGIKLNNTGQVIRFTDSTEKKYIGLTDCEGNYFYIRFNPNITFKEPERRVTSCQKAYLATAQCRIVALSFNGEVSSDKLSDQIIRNLRAFSSVNLLARPSILLKKQNFNYIDVLTEEAAGAISTGLEFTGIYIDFDLTWQQDDNNCEPCAIDIVREC
jgi:hypothetical protein